MFSGLSGLSGLSRKEVVVIKTQAKQYGRMGTLSPKEML